MITDKPILFVHVPKAAGTSITKVLSSKFSWNAPPGPPRPHHDPLFILEKYNDLSQFFVFAVVRNPYTRAFSYFNHFVKNNKCDVSYEEFLDHIRRKRQMVLNHHDATNITNIRRDNTPFIAYNQSFYTFDGKGKMSLDKLYRYENLSELEQDFDIKLSKANTGSYTKDLYLSTYNQTTIDLVKHIYLEDFINFNYSMDFV